MIDIAFIILVLSILLLVFYKSKKYKNELAKLSKNCSEISKIDYIKKLTDLNFEKDDAELVIKKFNFNK